MPRLPATPPAWMKQPARLPATAEGGRRTEWVDMLVLARAAWGAAAVDPLTAPGAAVAADPSAFVAFAYLYRRFGPPRHGGSPHKDLANYTLGTPLSGVFLEVHPGSAGLRLSLGCLVRRDRLAACERPHRVWWAEFDRWVGNACPGIDPADNDTAIPEAEAVIGPMPPRVSPRRWRAAPAPVRALNEALLAALRELLRPVTLRDTYLTVLGPTDRHRGACEPHPLSGLGLPAAVR